MCNASHEICLYTQYYGNTSSLPNQCSRCKFDKHLHQIHDQSIFFGTVIQYLETKTNEKKIIFGRDMFLESFYMRNIFSKQSSFWIRVLSLQKPKNLQWKKVNRK